MDDYLPIIIEILHFIFVLIQNVLSVTGMCNININNTCNMFIIDIIYILTC